MVNHGRVGQSAYMGKELYVYAGSRLLSTFTNNGSGGEVVEFHHPDRLGTRMVTNPSADTLYLQSTLPFGTLLSSETTGSSNRLFTTYDRSTATGLDYAVNRTYSPAQGRFTQVDPIGKGSVSIGNPQSFNLFAYVRNSPTDFVDPTGLNVAGPNTVFGSDLRGPGAFTGGLIEFQQQLQQAQVRFTDSVREILRDVPFEITYTADEFGNLLSTNFNIDLFISDNGFTFLLNSVSIFSFNSPGGGASTSGREPVYDREERERIRRTSQNNSPPEIPCVPGTLQIGLHGTAVLGVFGLTGGSGIAVDGSGNVGLYSEGGGGLGFGARLSGGFQGTISNANNINQLNGVFLNGSVGGNTGPGGSLNASFGKDSGTGRLISTAGGIISGGGGASASLAVTNTEVRPLGSVWDALGFQRRSQNGCNR